MTEAASGPQPAEAPRRPDPAASPLSPSAPPEGVFEPVVRHSSRIELSQSAMRNNLAFLRSRVGAHPVLSVVVKANAYGHGIEQTVQMAESCGISHFSVASSYEAQEVLAASRQNSRVMIMGILYDRDLTWVVENGVEFFVFDLPRLRQAAEVARRVGRPARIHLEIETGGNRTGLALDELAEALKIFRGNRQQLVFVGLCTHLAGTETLATRFRIVKQLEVFHSVANRLRQRRTGPEVYHVASSAAALSMPETALDLVRIGVATYGLWPSPDIYNLHLMRVNKVRDNPLQRVLTWKTDVMHLKRVKRDEFVGYGTAFQASRDMTLAVIPLGYSNGYPREMSNKGHVLIRGKKARVIGVVNMNMFMVDVSNIPDVQVGDEVVLVGRQRNNVITLRSFSEFSSALNTEFVCRLPPSIPRKITR
jgi:alanine racemase